MSGGFSDVNRMLLPETPSELSKRALAMEGVSAGPAPGPE